MVKIVYAADKTAGFREARFDIHDVECRVGDIVDIALFLCLDHRHLGARHLELCGFTVSFDCYNHWISPIPSF